ncbi:MAG TPA: hypothetical protein VNI54_14120 [Thermoanaerobaculia bacterium]|nr:hypothetical protein [Thermoanaerobaculia bacterium]
MLSPYVRRVARVRQSTGVGGFDAAALAEAEGDDVLMRKVELQLREDRARPAFFNESVAVAAELMRTIYDHQVVGLEETAHVVDADRAEALRPDELRERAPAAADDERFAVMDAAEVFISGGKIGCAHAEEWRQH